MRAPARTSACSQRRHVDGDQEVAQVAVVAQLAGRARGRCARRRRRPRWRSSSPPHRPRPRCAASTVTLSAMPSERLRPRQPLVATPRTGMSACTSKSASGASVARLARGTSKRARSAHRPDAHRRAGRQVQRDVAAVVDPGARQPVAVVGSDQLLRHRAGHRRHRRDEAAVAVRPAGVPHAPGDRRPRSGQSPSRTGRRSAAVRPPVRPASSGSARQAASCAASTARGVAVGADHDVDRSVLEVPAAVRQRARSAVNGALSRPMRPQPSSGGAPERPGIGRSGRLDAPARRRAVVVPARRARARPRAAARGPCGRPAPGSRRGACVNSIGATMAGVGTVPKLPVGHAQHVDHHRDAAARPHVGRRAAAGDVDQRVA